MIGIFDSGFGGLTVFKQIIKKLPNYDFIYLGDNKRAPYGGKSQALIYQYTKEAIDFLFENNCQLVILACNTASSQALRKIQQEYLPKKYPDKKVLGVIRPMAEKVVKNKKTKIVGVMGTEATILSQVYIKEIHKLDPKIKIIQNSAPLLVPLVEQGKTETNEAELLLKQYLQPFKKEKVNHLILACTHYPFFLKQINKILNKKCHIYNQGEVVADSLFNYLRRHPELKIKKRKTSKHLFFTTGDISKFKKQGELFLNLEIKSVKKINLL